MSWFDRLIEDALADEYVDELIMKAEKVEYYDCVICPEYQILPYRTTNRDGYREYHSDPEICAKCPTRHLCTRSKSYVKTVRRHIWKDYEDLADDARYTPECDDLPL